MGRVIVFLGPTLRHAAACRILAADYRGPAIQGDIYRAGLEQPDAILLIDGLFAAQPTVLHKEIMWVLSTGVPVMGAASLGALRAAELHAAGMQGIGHVFTDYRDGLIEDDDEVAIQHGPADVSWAPTSTAMIDIRYCLARARIDGVLRETPHQMALTLAKSMYFPERNYRNVLDGLTRAGQAADEIVALRQWLRVHEFSRKKLDAICALESLQSGRPIAKGRANTAAFPMTTYWQYHMKQTLNTSVETFQREGQGSLL